MRAVLLVYGLLFVWIPILNNNIENIQYIHNRYLIERSLRNGIDDAYKYNDSERAMDAFESSFSLNCPKDFEYMIELVDFLEKPKLVHFRVHAKNIDGLEIEIEETKIEEYK